MEIDRSITDEYLDKLLKAGRVLRRETIFEDNESSIKRLIVVTNNNQSTILAITTTSNITKRKYYNRDDIFLKAGEEEIFELDTYIQLNRVIEVKNEKLKEEFSQKKLDNLGVISNKLLNKMYVKIENSELIEQKYIKRIIEEK